MSGYVLLEQIEAVDDVLQRWHKEADFLQTVAQAEKIPFFYLQESRIRPADGMTVYFCLQLDSLRCIDLLHHLYDTEGIFLRPEDVAAYEQAHPELLWEPVQPGDPLVQEYGERIPAEVVRQWLGMSPMAFIDLLNSGRGPISSWEEAFRQNRQNPLNLGQTYFSLKDLKDARLTFHILDWKEWQKEHRQLLQIAPAALPGTTGSATASPQEKEARILALEEQLNARDIRITELEDLLRTKDRQIAVLEEQGPVDAQRWRDNMAAVCELLVSIMQGTKTDWIRDEFTTALARTCPRYLTEVEKLVWKALPDSYKHGIGRKKKI